MMRSRVMTTPRDLLIVAMDVPPDLLVDRGDLSLALAAAELIDLLAAKTLALRGDRVVPGPRPDGEEPDRDPLLGEALVAYGAATRSGEGGAATRSGGDEDEGGDEGRDADPGQEPHEAPAPGPAPETAGDAATAGGASGNPAQGPGERIEDWL